MTRLTQVILIFLAVTGWTFALMLGPQVVHLTEDVSGLEWKMKQLEKAIDILVENSK